MNSLPHRAAAHIKDHGVTSFAQAAWTYMQNSILWPARQRLEPSTGRMAVRSWTTDLPQLVDVDAPTIIDGGAYHGGTTADFLASYPDATIHAVEPVPEHAARLRSRYGDTDNIHVHQFALTADSTEIDINVSANGVSSSVHSPTAAYETALPDDNRMVESLTVSGKPLDEIVSGADIIKLDLQGHELPALRGADATLQSANALLSEVSFAQFYNGQTQFPDLADYVTKYGFDFHNFYALHTLPDGRLGWGDALFIDR